MPNGSRGAAPPRPAPPRPDSPNTHPGMSVGSGGAGTAPLRRHDPPRSQGAPSRPADGRAREPWCADSGSGQPGLPRGPVGVEGGLPRTAPTPPPAPCARAAAFGSNTARRRPHRLVPAALGSDGAGSVRIPAAWTHLIGVKPQRGRISTWPEPESFNGLTVNGVLARTVADAALLLDAAAGQHAEDLHRPAGIRAVEAAGRTPRRLRIALSFRMPFTATPKSLDPEVRSAVERLAGRLESLGHEVVPEDPRYGPIGLTFVPRATAGVRDWAARVPDRALLDRRTHEAVRTGRILGGLPLRLSRRAEAGLRWRVGEMFGRYDVVMTPTTATPPLRVGALEGLGAMATDRAMIAACPYAWTWNVLGWPGVNVPAGFTRTGLPLGAQLLGPAHSEPLLLSLAAQAEAAAAWSPARPS
ncbi:amidase family protein [Streptomyces sp. NPDC058619]|uniref:amidase family protein n=1 Tax=unclassified Streptomyces TaxID=2593676 RepID=UPI003646AB7B